MPAAKKRPRPDADVVVDFPENPYSLRVRPRTQSADQPAGGSKSKENKSKDGHEKKKKWHAQECPFKPVGTFRTANSSLDVEFEVIPDRWGSLNRYASFLLPGTKCSVNDFITVANDTSIKRQRTASAAAGDDAVKQPRPDGTKEWVGRILDIRASDEQHVYARVFWLYHPDELPAGTTTSTGKKIRGRQPYHGAFELIASNHMDIIHAATVTSVAQVTHWVERNDDDVHQSYYWRQAFNCNTFEISPSCEEWMHDRCLRHDALMRAYMRLGKDKAQEFSEADIPKATAQDEDKKDVNAILPTYSEPPLDHIWTAPKQGNAKEPYHGLFQATLVANDGAPVASVIEDLRQNVKGGSEKWLEPAYCLFCHEQIE